MTPLNKKHAFQYLKLNEQTDVSYVKIGLGLKNLIVCFTCNGQQTFNFKGTLINLKYERNDFDILYLRNNQKWYLGGLVGIGKNIEHTQAFLKKEFAKYDKVICVGVSMGGYGSILFGSLCGADNVISIRAQTNLEKLITSLPTDLNNEIVSTSINNLKRRKKECSFTWENYADLANVLNKNVKYSAYAVSDGFYRRKFDGITQKIELAFHGTYNVDTIKDFSSVEFFYTDLVYSNLMHRKTWQSDTNKQIVISNVNKILDSDTEVDK